MRVMRAIEGLEPYASIVMTTNELIRITTKSYSLLMMEMILPANICSSTC